MGETAFGKWLPIETAPKDGTDVLLWWPVQRQTETGAWMSPPRQYVEHWCRDRRWSPGEDPTHWMPLPAPPHPATDADLGEGGEGA